MGAPPKAAPRSGMPGPQASTSRMPIWARAALAAAVLSSVERTVPGGTSSAALAVTAKMGASSRRTVCGLAGVSRTSTEARCARREPLIQCELRMNGSTRCPWPSSSGVTRWARPGRSRWSLVGLCEPPSSTRWFVKRTPRGMWRLATATSTMSYGWSAGTPTKVQISRSLFGGTVKAGTRSVSRRGCRARAGGGVISRRTAAASAKRTWSIMTPREQGAPRPVKSVGRRGGLRSDGLLGEEAAEAPAVVPGEHERAQRDEEARPDACRVEEEVEEEDVHDHRREQHEGEGNEDPRERKRAAHELRREEQRQHVARAGERAEERARLGGHGRLGEKVEEAVQPEDDEDDPQDQARADDDPGHGTP